MAKIAKQRHKPWTPAKLTALAGTIEAPPEGTSAGFTLTSSTRVRTYTCAYTGTVFTRYLDDETYACELVAHANPLSGYDAIDTQQGGAGALTGLLNLTAGATGAGHDRYLMSVLRLPAGASAPGDSTALLWGMVADSGSAVDGFGTDNSGNFWCGPSDSSSPAPVNNALVYVVELVVNSSRATRRVYINGKYITEATCATSLATPAIGVGAMHWAYKTQQALLYAALWALAIPSFAARWLLLKFYGHRFGITVPPNLTYLGDSLSTGHITTGGVVVSTTDYPTELQSKYTADGVATTFDNLAASGQKLEYYLPIAQGGNLGPDMLEKCSPYCKNIRLIQLGSNDVAHALLPDGSSQATIDALAASMYATLTTIIEAHRAYPYTLIVGTVPPILDLSIYHENLRLTYNALVRANAARAAYVFDTATVTPWNIGVDNIHPDNTSLIALAAALKAFLAAIGLLP